MTFPVGRLDSTSPRAPAADYVWAGLTPEDIGIYTTKVAVVAQLGPPACTYGCIPHEPAA
jgi:hypothetical protein